MGTMEDLLSIEDRQRLPVVVGVDGSPRSKEALAWAVRYARAMGQPLRVVVAWRLPPSYGWEGPLPSEWDPEATAKEIGGAAVREALGDDPSMGCSIEVLEGHPARLLTEASKHASLVVVGSRGRGEFAGMLLGSVSAFVTAHARCPVVVVRDGAEPQPTH